MTQQQLEYRQNNIHPKTICITQTKDGKVNIMVTKIKNFNPTGKIASTFEGQPQVINHLILATGLHRLGEGFSSPSLPKMCAWVSTSTVTIGRKPMRTFVAKCNAYFEAIGKEATTELLQELLKEAATLPEPLIMSNGKKNQAGRGGGIFEGDETLNERLIGENGEAKPNSELKNEYDYDPATGIAEFEVDVTDEMVDEIRENRIRRLASQAGLTNEDGEYELSDEDLVTMEGVYGKPNYDDIPVTEAELLGLMGLGEGWEAASIGLSRGATWLRDYPGEDAYSRNITRAKGTVVNKKKILELAISQAPPMNIIVRELSVPVFKPAPKGMRTIASTPDPQVGFNKIPHTGMVVTVHDELAINVCSQIIRMIQPDMSVNCGDYLDLASASRYDGNPLEYGSLQMTINRGAQIARTLKLDAIMEGNHDKRLLTQIIANNAELFGISKAVLPEDEILQEPVISIKSLLRLDEIDCEFIEGYPSNMYRIHPRLIMIHGSVINSIGSTAAKLLKQEAGSDCIMFGHVHSAEFHQLSSGRDTSSASKRWAASDGTIARVDGAVPSTKTGLTSRGNLVRAYENWQQGMSIITVDDNDPTATPIREFIDITNGVAHFRGERIEANLEEIREDLEWTKNHGVSKLDIGCGKVLSF